MRLCYQFLKLFLLRFILQTMIIAKNKEELFEKYKAEFARWNENRKPLTHSKLELAYTDLNGLNYYRFPDSMQMPIERWGKAKDYMQWMAAGISPFELDKLIDFADEALNEGIKKGKGASRIGFALQEVRDRKTMIIHSELIYNFLAVHWVREDEQIEIIDDIIQAQKVEQFKKEVANGDSYFFFQERELKKIYDPFNMSPTELTEYFNRSVIKQEALKKMLQKYSSERESENSTIDGNQN